MVNSNDGTQQVLAYGDDINLVGDDVRTITKNAEVSAQTPKMKVLNCTII